MLCSTNRIHTITHHWIFQSNLISAFALWKTFRDDDIDSLLPSTSFLHCICHLFDLKTAAICQHLRFLRASRSTYTFTFDRRQTDNASFDNRKFVVCQTIGDVRIFYLPTVPWRVAVYKYVAETPICITNTMIWLCKRRIYTISDSERDKSQKSLYSLFPFWSDS